MAEKDYLVLTLGTRTKVILAWGSAVDCIQLLFIKYTTRLHSLRDAVFFIRQKRVFQALPELKERFCMVDQACGSGNIAGVSFSIHPMCDGFIEIIKDALNKVDASKVYMATDDVTTTVRGKLVHVFDVTKAIFIHAATTGEHVAFQATYSLGCPGDYSGDVFMAEDEEPINAKLVDSLKQPIAAKFSLYPLGGGNYMDIIYEQIEAMKKLVDVSPAHYSTRLNGEAILIFNGLKQVFQATVEGGSSHTVMTVSVSANSPSHKGVNDDYA